MPTGMNDTDTGCDASSQKDYIETASRDAELDAARYRASQLNSVITLIPLNTMANVMCGLLTIVVLWPSVPSEWLLIWGALLLGVISPSFYRWAKVSKPLRQPAHVSHSTLTHCVAHAGVLAVCWSLPAIVTFQLLANDQQLFLTAVTTGMMCAGGFVLYTIRQAAILYTSIIAASSVVVLLLSDITIWPHMLLLLFIYWLILSTVINTASEVFKAHVFSDLASERQSQVITLLLTDFEQSTADVLWQLDANLCIENSGTKLSQLFGDQSRQLNGQSFISLVKELHNNLPEDFIHPASLGLYELDRALKGGRSFRNLEFPVRIAQHLAWWSVTATCGEDRRWRGVIADNTVNYETSRIAWKLANQDTVTGLSNRRAFYEAIDTLFRKIKPDHTHAVLCIDLDRFKSVNDAFGHDSGDHLLQIVAARLSNHTRSSDVVARTGGDEFNVLLRNVTRTQAAEIGNQLLNSLQQPFQIGSNSVMAGASIGLAMIPEDGDGLDVIRKNADLALYKAKASGRGRLVSFSVRMADTAQQRLVLEQALREAMRNDELHLVYQPQQNLITGSISSVEALTRWHSPELGQVNTQTFISIAEDTGLIHSLGSWVLTQACAYLRKNSHLARLAVNVSPLQLVSPRIVQDIKNIIKEASIDPQRLELEITETVLLDDNHGAAEKLKSLKEFGVRIALDDFGTGYSSLRYLRRFPFDKIKIDRSFILDLTQENSSNAIVAAVISMARAMQMEVVAEGVETQETLDALRLIGCDTVQGYCISHPLKEEDMARYMADAQPGTSVASIESYDENGNTNSTPR